MSQLSTKEFNEIYKKNFKEYFDKALKKDGFYKKGTINFYRMNKLGMLEGLNFQRHYEKLTVNCYIMVTCCGVVQAFTSIGLRLGKFVNTREDYWWDVTDEEAMKRSMQEMITTIRTKLYAWFQELEKEETITEVISKSYQTIIYRYITQAATAAKFKRYDEILPFIEKVKKEYHSFSNEEKKLDFFKRTLEEALLLEEKGKEGKESVDQYILERERQTLIERGLEKLIPKE